VSAKAKGLLRVLAWRPFRNLDASKKTRTPTTAAEANKYGAAVDANGVALDPTTSGPISKRRKKP
jgi:hypothetical protein